MRFYSILTEKTFSQEVLVDKNMYPVGVIRGVKNRCCECRPVVVLQHMGSNFYEARCACGQRGTESGYTDPLDALNAFVKGETDDDEIAEVREQYGDD